MGMHRQSKTRAGNHQRHARTRKASPPTQANHSTRGARKQPPNQGAIHAASEDTTHTSHHAVCHQCARRRYASTAPTAGATGTSLACTQIKTRRPKARLDTKALARWGWPGLNTENRLGYAKGRSQAHTRVRVVQPRQVPAPVAGSTPCLAPRRPRGRWRSRRG